MNVRVEVPVPVMEVGLKPVVTPVGIPEAERETGELNDPLTVLVMVVVPDAPWATETEAGEAERVKPEVEPEPVSAAIRPALGLPQPVTRSKPVTAE